MGWGRANTAVIEVDQRPVGVEAALDLRPIIFITGQIDCRVASRIVTGLNRPGDRIPAEHHVTSARNGRQAAEECASRTDLAKSFSLRVSGHRGSLVFTPLAAARQARPDRR